jgi:hypothetical protein
MTEEEQNWFVDFINYRYWRPAKLQPPHQYTIREWRSEQEADFEKAVELIRKYGVPENFYKKIHIYLYIDGLKYWTMGWPVNETTVINRCDSRMFYGKQVV